MKKIYRYLSILCKIKRNDHKLNLKIDSADNIFIQIINLIKNDFNLDMLNVNANFKNFEKREKKVKGLNLIELFIFIIIIYKSEEDHVNFFMKIELVSEFYDTEGLKIFLSTIVQKVHDNFNKKKIEKKNNFYADLEDKIVEYEHILQQNKINEMELRDKNKNFKLKLEKKIEIINILTQERNDFHSKLNKLNDSIKTKIENKMNNKKKEWKIKKEILSKRIEKFKKKNNDLEKKLEEISEKNEFLIFENKDFEYKISKIPENYVKIDKFNKLQKSYSELIKKIYTLENSLLIQNSEKDNLKDKLYKIKDNHGKEMEFQENSYLSKISDLEKKYLSDPKKKTEDNDVNYSSNKKILKKSFFFDDFEESKNEKNINEMIKNKLDKTKMNENSSLSYLTLPESVFEDFDHDNFLKLKRNIESENLNESNFLLEDEKKFSVIGECKTLKMKNDFSTNKVDLKELKKIKDLNRVLKKDRAKFHKGFKKIKKILGIRNEKISFGIIFKEIEILINRLRKLKKNNTFYKKSKLKIVDRKNDQISLLYSLLIKE